MNLDQDTFVLAEPCRSATTGASIAAARPASRSSVSSSTRPASNASVTVKVASLSRSLRRLRYAHREQCASSMWIDTAMPSAGQSSAERAVHLR